MLAVVGHDWRTSDREMPLTPAALGEFDGRLSPSVDDAEKAQVVGST